MDHQTEALLTWLRQIMKERGMNVAALAGASGIERTRLRRVLKGSQEMLVSELLSVSAALEVKPSDMGLGEAPDGEGSDASIEDAADVPEVVALDDSISRIDADPFGNHPKTLFEMGFALGCDFLFLCRTDELGDSGLPAATLKQFAGRDLPIKLEALYHRYNEPQFTDEAITLVLSFDALYTCTFPWASIHQVIFYPAAPELPEPSEEVEELPSGRPPFLRLVD